jgi:uncharacterized lipoprotein YbaY
VRACLQHQDSVVSRQLSFRGRVLRSNIPAALGARIGSSDGLLFVIGSRTE